MEKKKIKLWKVAFLIATIVLLIFIIMTSRKMMIFSSLDGKIARYENSKNIYVKHIVDDTTMETYIKDENVKQSLIRNTDGKKYSLIQIRYPTQRKVYIDDGNVKELKITNVSEENIQPLYIYNISHSVSFQELLWNSLTSSIKSVKLDNKECYLVSSLKNTNLGITEDIKEILTYVEKDTGLVLKQVEIYKSGEKVDMTSSYEYMIDTVDEEDMKEPDSNEYIVV